MSWPEQRVSPPIYNIKARYVAVAALFLSLAKLYRQTFHRVREAPVLRNFPVDIHTHTHTIVSHIHSSPSSPPPPIGTLSKFLGEYVSYRNDTLVNITYIRRCRSRAGHHTAPYRVRRVIIYAPRTCRLFQERRDNGKT